MKQNQFRIYNLLKTVGVLSVMTAGFHLIGKPAVSNLTIRMGTSPKILRYSWATMTAHLKNPDSKEAVVQMRLVDNLKGVYGQHTVFSDIVTIPPHTKIHYSSIVQIENAEEYFLKIFYKGKQIGKTASALIKIASNKGHYIPIFNDDDNINLGTFRDLQGFKDRYVPSFFYATTPCNKWSLLRKVPFIIMVHPDFSKYSAQKYQALINYVNEGGSIIFVNPECVKEATETPLAPILPVIPLRMEKISLLPEMKALIPSFKRFSSPVNFLKSAPQGDGITILTSKGFPILRIKKIGMGNCVFLAVPAIEDVYNSKEEWKSILDYLFTSRKLYNDPEKVEAVLNEMTGFTVPNQSAVQWIIVLYFIILAIPLGIGIYYRKTGIAWIAGGVSALIFTITLFYISLSEGNVHKKDFLSFIEIIAPYADTMPGIGYYGIMSASDKTVTIKANSSKTLFSSLPPAETRMFLPGQGLNHQSILDVKRVDGLSEIYNLNLPVNAPRDFYAEFASTGSQTVKYLSPRLIYNGEKRKFSNWNIPKGVNPEAAWLQFPSGSMQLTLKNGIISENRGGDVFHSDIIQESIKQFTNDGVRHSDPLLILLQNVDKTSTFNFKNTIIHGRRIIAIPVTQVFETADTTIHHDEISLLPATSSSRLIMDGNKIKPSIFSRSDNDYTFLFQLPEYTSEFKPKKIKCEFSYANDSKNIEITPFLLRKTEYLKEKNASPIDRTVMKMEQVPFEKNEHGIYTLSLPDGIIDKNTRSGTIGIQIKIKDKTIPLGAQRKNNTWRIKKFNITIDCKIREFNKKISY